MRGGGVVVYWCFEGGAGAQNGEEEDQRFAAAGVLRHRIEYVDGQAAHEEPEEERMRREVAR